MLIVYLSLFLQEDRAEAFQVKEERTELKPWDNADGSLKFSFGYPPAFLHTVTLISHLIGENLCFESAFIPDHQQKGTTTDQILFGWWTYTYWPVCITHLSIIYLTSFHFQRVLVTHSPSESASDHSIAFGWIIQ